MTIEPPYPALARLHLQHLHRARSSDAAGEPPALLSFSRFAAFTAATTGFSNVTSSPHGQIVNHSALLKEVETGTAALLESVSDMDDLSLQFDGTGSQQAIRRSMETRPHHRGHGRRSRRHFANATAAHAATGIKQI